MYGCGCKEVYRFPHTTYPYSSCICSFLQQQPYFLFNLKKMFFVLLLLLLLRAKQTTLCGQWSHCHEKKKYICIYIYLVHQSGPVGATCNVQT